VNCAGGSRLPAGKARPPDGERSGRVPAVEVTEAELDEAFAINVKSTLFCSAAAAPEMINRGSGSIINVTSRYAVIPSVGRLPYGVAKAGVSSLTRTLAREWGTGGIRVNEISPYARTAATDWRLHDPVERERLLAGIALGRVAEPYEVAGTAVFLASPLSSYVTGQTISVNGGRLG
ncbi:MAG: SDR family oxidoreductase, partial [Actinobacteria bacterium]|nr:SDR family oxidoreductase [Actinomycetota bacterium]